MVWVTPRTIAVKHVMSWFERGDVYLSTVLVFVMCSHFTTFQSPTVEAVGGA